MKKKIIPFPELLKYLAFLLYLGSSSLTLIEHGIELSLWLMTLAVVIDITTTILPRLGFNWLALEKKGSSAGYWTSILIQIAAWGCFGYAMILRLWRNLNPFYRMITYSTLLWAVGLLIFIYSRHAWVERKMGDTLNDSQIDQSDENQKGIS